MDFHDPGNFREGDGGESLSCVRSGHGSANMDTIFTTFLVMNRKKTGVKGEKTN